MKIRDGVEVDSGQLAELCRKYNVIELSVFGSAVRDDFRADSDIDLLVVFEPDAEVGFLHLGALSRELERLLGRPVDLVPKEGLKDLIRGSVLSEARVLHAS